MSRYTVYTVTIWNLCLRKENECCIFYYFIKLHIKSKTVQSQRVYDHYQMIYDVYAKISEGIIPPLTPPLPTTALQEVKNII